MRAGGESRDREEKDRMSSCVGIRKGSVDGRTQARREAGGVKTGRAAVWGTERAVWTEGHRPAEKQEALGVGLTASGN